MIKVRSKKTPTSKTEIPTLERKLFVNTLKKTNNENTINPVKIIMEINRSEFAENTLLLGIDRIALQIYTKIQEIKINFKVLSKRFPPPLIFLHYTWPE
jgi:hypothetical protein